MKVHCKGILRHMFHMPYRAAIALEFESDQHAELAKETLGDKWMFGEVMKNILVWSGESDALEEVKKTLGKFGADEDKIDSIKYSIDHGEPFTADIEVISPDQGKLF